MAKEKPELKVVQDLIAKRDFKFSFNGKIYDIKEGDVIDVPEILLINLKTEKVI